MRIDQYRTEKFADETDRAAYFRMIVREAYQYDSERDAQRRLENEIVACVAILGSRASDHLHECAEQIRDHRENGNYTTRHR